MLFLFTGLSISLPVAIGLMGFFDMDLGILSSKEDKWKKDIEDKYSGAYERTRELIEVIDDNYSALKMKTIMVSQRMSLYGIFQLLNNYLEYFDEETIEYIQESELTENDYLNYIEAYEDHLERIKQFEIYFYQSLH